MTDSGRGANWSDDENDAVVEAYLELLVAELRGQSPVKAEARRRVEALTGRSRGSVEFKFQNVSAALIEMRMPFVRGYKPASNFQNSLSAAVIRRMDNRPDLLEAAMQDVVRTAPSPAPSFDWSDHAIPELAHSKHVDRLRRATKVDFVLLDAANRSLGLAGELAVVRRERAALTLVGRGDLAARVEHVSQTQGDGLGFDILSFDRAGAERYLEVKTTRRGIGWPMLVSDNEVRVSAAQAQRYEVHRVFDYRPNAAGIYVLRGAIEDSCVLTGSQYEALPRRLAG